MTLIFIINFLFLCYEEISLLYLKKFRNGEHYTYHAAVLEIVDADTANDLGFSDLYSAYVEKFNIEDLSLKSELGARNTKAIAEKDAERDKVFNYISDTISLQCNAPDDGAAAAAENLAHLLKGYKNLSARTYSDESALITNLLQDIRKPPYDACVNALGLEPMLERLEKLNGEFAQLYADRNVNATERADVPNMAEIRPQVDMLYRKIVSLINSLYEVNEMIQHDESKKEVLGPIIDKLNARIAQENHNIAMRRGRAAAASADGRK